MGRGRGRPQIFCIFLFLCAASLFGTLISQVNEIVNQQTSMSKELDVILEAYLAVEPKCVDGQLVSERGGCLEGWGYWGWRAMPCDFTRGKGATLFFLVCSVSGVRFGWLDSIRFVA
jgi:hypothetical protein